MTLGTPALLDIDCDLPEVCGAHPESATQLNSMQPLLSPLHVALELVPERHSDEPRSLRSSWGLVLANWDYVHAVECALRRLHTRHGRAGSLELAHS